MMTVRILLKGPRYGNEPGDTLTMGLIKGGGERERTSKESKTRGGARESKEKRV